MRNKPGLVEEAKQDIRGVGLASDAMDLAVHGVAGKKIPKQKGLTSGVVSMSGEGTGKGSEAMRLKMQKLRAMRKKK